MSIVYRYVKKNTQDLMCTQIKNVANTINK